MSSEVKAGSLILGICILILMLVVGFIQYNNTQENQSKIDTILTKLADKLNETKDSYGHYRQLAIYQEDIWGNEIKISYSSKLGNEVIEILEVRSAGPDGKLYTEDDLFQTRTNIVPINN